MGSYTRHLLSTAIVSANVLGAVLWSGGAGAAQATEDNDTAARLDTVIVTGTRAQERTASASLSPIDVISGDSLRSSGSGELATVLAKLIPSINFPRPSLVDGAELTRPAQLRGLSPDQVLVLVNGKRRHTSAFVNLGGAVGRGSAPADLNAIPLSAIDHIEVLRDGASARYGSDAIAGVINIILKSADHGGSISTKYGQYKKGDGIQRQVAGNSGFALGDNGFVSLSGEGANNDYTDRAGKDFRPASVGSTTYGQHVFRQGEPETEEGKFQFNSAYSFNDAAELYGFGGYSKRRGETAAFYRASNASNNNRVLHPNGYLPLINGTLEDTSLVVGLRGELLDNWHYDLSANYGKNTYELRTKTINTSLGLNTPHAFDNGTLTNDQRQLSLDLSREFSLGWLPYPVSVAFGTEYLHQGYQIEAGQPESYYQTGSSGLGGFRDSDAGSSSRHNFAQYLDLETNFTDKLAVSAAVRHEDYSDFGSNVSGSLSARYDFTPRVALRGSVSTGFRAPSLAQQNFTFTSSQLIGNTIQESGTFAADSQVARLLGAEDLKAEKSRNYSLGLVLEPLDNLTVTADLYHIDIRDRVSLSSNLVLNNTAIDYLKANGVGNINYTSARYFTNATDTSTDGVDLVANYRYQLDNGIRWSSTVGYNYNHTKVTDVKANPAILDQLGVNLVRVDRRERIGLLGDTTPQHKLSLANDFNYGNWALHSNLVRYGEFTSYQADKVNDQTFSAAWLLDLAVDYKLQNWLFTLGGDNVTDKYPEKVNAYASSGGNLAYSTFSPYGYSGAFYYAKVAYNW
ncbi:TonB-dependent receptor plug domain-containing protein [Pseudomonas chlororaphis]|uniref:TonB-dependent receptor:TonB-dependent receptor n=1 Tax=Pseudomonas chlororaphis TaxID=587753 RepID=A0AAX3FPB9_9PSED|nr:TonB-dependent receptor [Pseudomonas chlororaphis]AZC38030.1 TonB-dependent receptor [Pseudomonas chlororaphis subsp. piscium]AZC44576.1 TonB-dependent receptor [Pseudomonas chlororaphis subsp. piscium]AZC64038.1 TonB-dependent receptor [Pseudomonas chlororaphis subsp. piscium]KZO48798.1 ligand-gated channel [Pseudomonas chlororaphis subsp. piscium]MBP5069364.1 TonB-dependent receptor [Pseudomonas chlororaphis]